MRSSSDIYKNVAENCSQYSARTDRDSFIDTTHDTSCTTCKHFAEGAYCDIDVYDEIVSNHDFQ